MKTMQARIITLEAQINAMAQAWLCLAANIEAQCGIDMQEMEDTMRRIRWHNTPSINDEGGLMLRWLSNQLSQARAVREANTVDHVSEMVH